MQRDYSLIKRSCRSLPAGWRQHTCVPAPGGAGSGCLLPAGSHSDPVSAGTNVGSANGMYVRTITHKYWFAGYRAISVVASCLPSATRPMHGALLCCLVFTACRGLRSVLTHGMWEGASVQCLCGPPELNPTYSFHPHLHWDFVLRLLALQTEDKDCCGVWHLPEEQTTEQSWGGCYPGIFHPCPFLSFSLKKTPNPIPLYLVICEGLNSACLSLSKRGWKTPLW